MCCGSLRLCCLVFLLFFLRSDGLGSAMAHFIPLEILQIRLVVIGKTSSGKSSLGNTLLRKEAFQVGRGLISETKQCHWSHGNYHGIQLKVTDTPGVCDTHRTADEVRREVTKSLALSTPGPHAVIMVIPYARFTEEEYKAYIILKDMFGERLTKFIIIAFTWADEMPGNTYEARIDLFKKELRDVSDELKTVLKEAKHRYCIIGNKDSDHMKDLQIRNLIKMVQELVTQNKADGLSYFRNELLQELTTRVEDKVQQRMERNQETHETADVKVRKAITHDV
ncbi:GTPase IMAP family member 4-like [Babylonia areolata]|uniref:GTPase IMAP family member 4-like n=1 Tax=Babylonia areolata TaxID=304850 RepID=UPI003FD1ECF3